MRQWIKTAAVTVGAVLLLALGGGLFVIYSGSYNVAATEEHWGVTQWALDKLQQTSVGARADEVAGSIPEDSAALDHGFDHFHAMCVMCHGAPGLDRGEVGAGMRPVPPRLEEVAQEWSDQEIFWIIENGIRLAGMPAFGATHGDEEIWGIVAFVREVEGMTEEEYARRVRALQEGGDGGGEEGGHSHAPGTPAHEH